VEAITRALSVTVVGLIAFTVVRVLNAVGLLDDTFAALIQLLLIPVRLVGVLLAAIRHLVTGDPAPSPTSSGGLGVPALPVVGSLVVAGLVVFRRPILAKLRRRWLGRRPRAVPARPSPAPAPAPAPASVVVAVPAPAPPVPEGAARVASWDTAAAAARYRAWLSEVSR
jgi:hypothetical protein